MKGHGQKLTRKQEEFIAALLVCPTVTQAAKQAGISEATSSRWRKDEAFAEAYRQARRQALDGVLSFLEQSMVGAVATLRTVMLAAETPAATKVRAALGLLELGLRASMLEDQEARLAALEAQRGIER
jgi:hypothetical protein